MCAGLIEVLIRCVIFPGSVDLLLEVKEQNKQILALLEKNFVNTLGVREQNKIFLALLEKSSVIPVRDIFLPDDFPIDLPCTLQNDLEVLENYLSEKANLKVLVHII